MNVYISIDTVKYTHHELMDKTTGPVMIKDEW